MSKIYLICGKICSGKSYYAKALKDENHAVISSTDEAPASNEIDIWYKVER